MSATAQNAPSHFIIACPISKYEVQQVAGLGLLLRLHYVEKAEQFKTGEHTTLQVLLAPDQAVEMQGELKKSMQALEFGKALKKSLRLLGAPSQNTPVLACQ